MREARAVRADDARGGRRNVAVRIRSYSRGRCVRERFATKPVVGGRAWKQRRPVIGETGGGGGGGGGRRKRRRREEETVGWTGTDCLSVREHGGRPLAVGDTLQHHREDDARVYDVDWYFEYYSLSLHVGREMIFRAEMSSEKVCLCDKNKTSRRGATFMRFALLPRLFLFIRMALLLLKTKTKKNKKLPLRKNDRHSSTRTQRVRV